jgi:hypothetical protein
VAESIAAVRGAGPRGFVRESPRQRGTGHSFCRSHRFDVARHRRRVTPPGKCDSARSAADPLRREAPCLYPRCSREELGGRFLGLMADLDPKGEGDQSMPGKRWPCPGVRARGAVGPAEYGESWIASSLISRRCKPPSTGKTSEPVPCPALVFRIRRRNLRSTERCPMRAFKEMSGPPTFCSTRTTRTNAGSPTGRESYGDGGLVLVAGVTTCQGVRESRTQGEAGQVIGHHDPGRYA